MIIPAHQFLQEVEALGFKCWEPRDRKVFCPSAEWLVEFWGYLKGQPDFKKALASTDDEESWDCDDYALSSVTQASIACRAAGRGTGHTLVYCTVRLWSALNDVEPDSQQISGHATNLVRLNSGVYVFFEPQNGKTCDARLAIADGVAVPVNALL